MMYSSASIQLILINNATNQDDKVSIRKNLTYNEFDITYTENSPGELPQVHRITGLSHQSVLEYTHLLLKSQYVDDEPYSSIQLNVPAMPRVILSAAKFHETYHRDHFYDMVSAGMGYLETVEVSIATKKQALARKPLTVRKAAKAPKKVETLPVSESEGEIVDENDCSYSDAYISCKKCKYDLPASFSPSLRSIPSGVRPQHQFWE